MDIHVHTDINIYSFMYKYIFIHTHIHVTTDTARTAKFVTDAVFHAPMFALNDDAELNACEPTTRGPRGFKAPITSTRTHARASAHTHTHMHMHTHTAI